MKQGDVQSEIQRLIVDYLERMEVSQRQFAELMGVSDATYGGYRRMETPIKLDIVDKIISEYPELRTILANYLTGNKMENNTHGGNASKNNEKGQGDPEVYRTIVEGKTEYVLILKSVIRDSKLIDRDQWDTTKEMVKTNQEMVRNSQEIMKIMVNEFVQAVERLSSPQPSQTKKSKHSG